MSYTVLRRSQIAPEATMGTAVPPTRQLGGALVMQPADERRLRESRRASMLGPNLWEDMTYMSRGSYTGRYVHNDAVFFLASSMRGNVAPVGPLWTYKQQATLDPLKSLTVYCGDNTKALRAAGVFTSRLEIAGADTDWWRINAALLGRRLVGDQTGPTYDFNTTTLFTGPGEGAKNKKTILYIDNVGTAIGTTLKSQTGYRFRWIFDSKIDPDMSWDTGSLDMNDITRDIPEITLELTTKWNATAVIEYQKQMGEPVDIGSPATRLIRIGNTGGETAPGVNFLTTIDGAYVCTGFEPLAEERDGLQLARVTYTAIEDPTFGKCTVSVRNQMTATDLPVV